MKTMKKRGFTLVELLVVIAILAILATVSVVGYTAFIERAYVSNDENIAAQMNQYLVALKADSDGLYYEELQANGGKVTANNVREITDYILADSGLGKLIPQSADYGYHFYFDLVEQEYVLIGDKDDRVNTQAMINAIFAAEIPNVIVTDYPETQITKNARYFLVETGTPLAEIMTAFRGVENKEDLAALKTAVENTLAKNKRPYKGLVEYLNSVVFVTSEGRLVTDLTATHTNLIIQSGLALSADKENNKLVSFSGTPSDTVINPFVTVSEKVVIPMTLGEGVVLQTNAWMFDYGNDEMRRPVLEFEGINTVAELQEHIDVGFTNALILLGDTYYYFDGSDIKNLNGEVAGTVENKNTVKDFTVSCDAVEAGVLTFGASGTDTYTLYIHYNKTDAFNLNVGGFVGELSNENIYGTENISFNKVNGGSSKLSVSADGTVQVTGLPETDDCAAVIKVTCGDVVKTINVQIVRHTNANITLNGQTFNMVQGGTFVIKQTSTSSNTYSFTHKVEETHFNLDETLSVTTDEETCFTIENNVLTLNDTDFEGTQTIKVSVGGVLVQTFTVVVQDYENNAFVVGLQNHERYLYRVGNQNTFKLGSIFDLSSDDKVLSENVTLRIYDASKPIANSNSWSLVSTSTNFKVNANEVTLTPAEWEAYEINFNQTSGVAIIEVEYRDMTTRVPVEVVNGYNVTDYSELQTGSGKNNVLLGNITLTEGSTFTISANTYFYGNGYTFDVTAGPTTGGYKGNITVSSNAVLDNTVVIGPEFPEVPMNKDFEYGRSTVVLNGGIISNSYISGGFEAVGSNGGRIENTTLAGGGFANLNLYGGELTVCNLTTINQTSDKNSSCGLGIVLTIGAKNLILEGSLTQYNWISKKGDGSAFEGLASMLHSAVFKSDEILFPYDNDTWANTGILIATEQGKVTNFEDYGYIGVQQTIQGVTGTAYSMDNEKHTFSGKPTAPEYHATAQCTYKPTITFVSSKIQQSGNVGDEDYLKVVTENGVQVIRMGMDIATTSKTLDLTEIFSVSKYTGQNLVPTYYLNGEVINGKTVTFNRNGIYKLKVVVVDQRFYGPDGNTIDKTIEYSKEITVYVANTKMTNAIISTDDVDGDIFYHRRDDSALDKEYAPTVPVFNCLKIKDYIWNEETGSYEEYTITSEEELYKLYTEGKIIISSNLPSDLVYYNNNFYYTTKAKGDTKATLSSTITITYKYTGNSGTTVTATKTYQFETGTVKSLNLYFTTIYWSEGGTQEKECTWDTLPTFSEE